MRVVRRFSRADAAVLLLSMLLLWNLAAVGGSGRERARQTVCLANLRQLTSGWLSYAEANDGKLVNGAAGINRIWLGSKKEIAWVGQCWASDYAAGGRLPVAQQIINIQMGALWPFAHETRLYRCPGGHPGQLLSYAIVDSMNGLARTGTSEGYENGTRGIKVGDTVLWVRNLAEITVPGPAERMVFIDQGLSVPDSFSTHYRMEAWWDLPPVRHGDGTSVSFADGHCEDWRWQGEETIRNGRAYQPDQPYPTYKLATPEDRDDLHRLQKAVWGRLGY